jgi:hypothetical protein
MRVDLSSSTTHLVLFGGLVAAGAVATAACGPAGTLVSLAGAGALREVLGALAGVVRRNCPSTSVSVTCARCSWGG